MEDFSPPNERISYLTHLATAYLMAEPGSREESLLDEAHGLACARLGMDATEHVEDVQEQLETDGPPGKLPPPAELLSIGERITRLGAKLTEAGHEAFLLATKAAPSPYRYDSSEVHDGLMQARYRLTEAQAHVRAANAMISQGTADTIVEVTEPSPERA
jgi:hypothetical protein